MDLYANAPDFGAQAITMPAGLTVREMEARQANPLIGKRVEIPVHTDAWMRGDRYGEITSAKGDRIVVKLDKSERKIEMHVQSVYRFV